MCSETSRARSRPRGKPVNWRRRLEFGLIEASALENLAFAEATAGKLTEAIAHAEAALEVRARSQSQVWASKTLADLAVWHAALANLPAARDHVRRMLADEKSISDQHGVAGVLLLGSRSGFSSRRGLCPKLRARSNARDR